MFKKFLGNRKKLSHRICSGFLTLILVFNFTLPSGVAYAQLIQFPGVNLPAPGTMVQISEGYAPLVLQGVVINPENPLKLKFIIDTGDSGLEGEALNQEALKVIKYFFAALTIPQDDMWVNLSPYEGDKMIPEMFGQTEMGRDMLAQDYILKQLTASLMFPDEKTGKEFWTRVYARAKELYGTTQLPFNTFNKIWITPKTATIYESTQGALAADERMEVMLERDYLSLAENADNPKFGMVNASVADLNETDKLTQQMVREVLIPEVEREVNEGKHFANLRQIYSALVLASWFKQALKNSLLDQIYVDKNKIAGVNLGDKTENEKIYQQYLDAFQKGVYDFIKEEPDPATNKIIPRKYYSGGFASKEIAGPGGIAKKLPMSSLGSSPAKGRILEVTTVINEIGKGATPADLEEFNKSIRGTLDASSPVESNGFSSEVKRILVVDDSPDIRMLSRDRFKFAGYEVLEAGSAKQAMGILRSDGSVSLVVTDFNMLADGNGLDLAKEIRATPGMENIPIILSSGEDESHLMAKYPDGMKNITAFVRKGSNRLMETITRLSASSPVGKDIPRGISLGNVFWRIIQTEGLKGISITGNETVSIGPVNVFDPNDLKFQVLVEALKKVKQLAPETVVTANIQDGKDIYYVGDGQVRVEFAIGQLPKGLSDEFFSWLPSIQEKIQDAKISGNAFGFINDGQTILQLDFPSASSPVSLAETINREWEAYFVSLGSGYDNRKALTRELLNVYEENYISDREIPFLMNELSGMIQGYRKVKSVEEANTGVEKILAGIDAIYDKKGSSLAAKQGSFEAFKKILETVQSIPPSVASSPVENLLNHPDRLIRLNAVQGLAIFENDSAMTPLSERLGIEADDEVRVEILKAMDVIEGISKSASSPIAEEHRDELVNIIQPILQGKIRRVNLKLEEAIRAYSRAEKNGEEFKKAEKVIAGIVDDLNKFDQVPVEELSSARNIHKLDDFVQSADFKRYFEKAKEDVLNGKYVGRFLFAGAATRFGGPLYFVDLWNVAKNEGKIAEGEGLYSLGMGPRQLIAFRMAIEELARSNNLDAAQVLAKQKMIIHTNQEVHDQILEDFKKNNFYGFSRENIFFIMQPLLPGFRLENGELVLDETIKFMPYGHGYNLMQLGQKGVAVQIGREGDVVTFSENVLGQLSDDTIIVSHRINDLTKFITSEVIGLEKLAYRLYLHETGKNFVGELVGNPDKQKGGSVLQYLRDGKLKKFLIETLNAKGLPALDRLVEQAAVEGAPYNAFRVSNMAGQLKNILEKIALPYSVRFKDGHIYSELVTGDMTQIEDVDADFFLREGEFIHDFKEMKHLTDALYYVKEQDRELQNLGGRASSPIKDQIDELIKPLVQDSFPLSKVAEARLMSSLSALAVSSREAVLPMLEMLENPPGVKLVNQEAVRQVIAQALVNVPAVREMMGEDEVIRLSTSEHMVVRWVGQRILNGKTSPAVASSPVIQISDESLRSRLDQLALYGDKTKETLRRLVQEYNDKRFEDLVQVNEFLRGLGPGNSPDEQLAIGELKDMIGQQWIARNARASSSPVANIRQLSPEETESLFNKYRNEGIIVNVVSAVDNNNRPVRYENIVPREQLRPKVATGELVAVRWNNENQIVRSNVYEQLTGVKLNGAVVQTPDQKGGIDFNPEFLDLQIKRDGNGVPLSIDRQPVQWIERQIQGIVPVIINVAPVTNLPMLLGVTSSAEDTNPLTKTYPQFPGRDPQDLLLAALGKQETDPS